MASRQTAHGFRMFELKRLGSDQAIITEAAGSEAWVAQG